MFEFFLSPIFHFPKIFPKSISCIFRKKAVILQRNFKTSYYEIKIVYLRAVVRFRADGM